MTLESREKMSRVRKGRKQNPEHIENLRKSRKGQKRPTITGDKNPIFGTVRPPHVIEAIKKAQTGRKHPPRSKEWRDKLSAALKGEKGSNWRGGVTPEHRRIRFSAAYRDWRKAVFERDDYTCQFCGERGGILNADHIQPFAYFPELRLSIENGRTLCLACHKTTPTYASHR